MALGDLIYCTMCRRESATVRSEPAVETYAGRNVVVGWWAQLRCGHEAPVSTVDRRTA